MILGVFLGILVSVSCYGFFKFLHFGHSVNTWIIENSKFIYVVGHPLLDDEETQAELNKKFGKVFHSLVVVTGKTLLFLAYVLVMVMLSSVAYSYFTSGSMPTLQSGGLLSILLADYLFDVPFIVGTLTPIALIPLFAPNGKPDESSQSAYSPLEKFLHYAFLGNSNIARFLFRMELLVQRKLLSSQPRVRSIYISGMARAGTTVLMQYLGQLPSCESISYRNMPFLFLPKTWQRFSGGADKKERERYHQDGMQHSLDSYEALEEPFWRNYLGKEYIKGNRLCVHKLSKKIYGNYNSFRKLIAGDKIYLCKNNNHLLRAQSLHQMDAESGCEIDTVIPFRQPYRQARSLLRQHQVLSQLQNKDEFALDYMDFLAHHEFGLHHKMTDLRAENNTPAITEDPNKLDYWLEIWYRFYKQADEIFSEKDGFHLFCYERFAINPRASTECLLKKLGLPEDQVECITFSNYTPIGAEEGLGEDNKYIRLYRKMGLKAINNEC